MNLKKAFIMYRYFFCEEGLILHGRVMEDIKLGDTLFILDYLKTAKDYSFIIEKINAYRHAFDEINEGMTCELIVSGEQLDLEEDCIFYVER